MSFIQARSVSMSYKANGNAAVECVLRDVSLEMPEGEFAVLMGPSGSGKSTLLGILGAMTPPTKGSLKVDGIDVYGLSEDRRADFRFEYLGFVFQQLNLLPFLNVLENVQVPLAISKLKSMQQKEKAIAALERVGLSGKEKRLPGELSGGEQERVAIARAIVNDPPIILADEPTGNLDSSTSQRIMNLFGELNQRGQTILMVTHNPDNLDYSTVGYHMLDGRLSGLDSALRTPTPISSQNVAASCNSTLAECGICGG